MMYFQAAPFYLCMYLFVCLFILLSRAFVQSDAPPPLGKIYQPMKGLHILYEWPLSSKWLEVLTLEAGNHNGSTGR